MHSARMITAALAALLLSPVAALADPVIPGGSFFNYVDNFQGAAGTVLAEDVRPITLRYDPGNLSFFDAGEDGVYDGTFRSRVVRNPATQHLAFEYELDFVAGNLADESGIFRIASFGTGATDVRAKGGWTIFRSSDGSTIRGENLGQGAGVLPHFVVETDATNFDRGGSVDGDFGSEFAFRGTDSNPDFGVLHAALSLHGTFEPEAAGGTTAIPLPAAAWTGLIGLVVALTAGRWVLRPARP